MPLLALAAVLFATPPTLPPDPLAAEGLFHRLPSDGSWVRFRVQYLFKAGEQEQRGEQVLRMASVGTVTEAGEICRWIEFRIDATENGVEKFWIRKLLIPVRFLRAGENPTAHVIRGWTQQETGPIEPAVAVHGRWPAFLAGRLEDERALAPELVRSGLGERPTPGVTGWIAFTEGTQRSKVTMETRLDPEAPFGVVRARMVFDVTAGEAHYTIDSVALLEATGTGATTALPKHR